VVNSHFESAIFALSHPKESHVDDVVDLFVAAAVEAGRLHCMGDGFLLFTVGQNYRRSVEFSDCLGVFRSVLARLYTRCEKAYPYRMEGNRYGFKAHVMFPFSDGQSAELSIQTRNTREFPEFTLETEAAHGDGARENRGSQ
jgi:hypothetical protein